MSLPFAGGATRRRGTVHQRRAYLMKVADLMSAKPVTVAPDATFPQIVDTLLAHDLSVVPVVDDAGRLLGVISEADLIAKETFGPDVAATGRLRPERQHRGAGQARRPVPTCARDLMTREVDTAGPQEQVAVVARRMLATRRKYLPVVDGDTCVGMLARADLLRPFARADLDVERDVQAILADPLRVPEGHQASATVRDGVLRLRGSTHYPRDVDVLCAVLSRVPGVVDLDCALRARHPEPQPSSVPARRMPWA